MGKVRYGIENVYYALESSSGGWDTPKALKGAVSLSLDTEGQTSTFYADNGAYATFGSNMGYTGDLEIACIEDEAAVDILGYTKDSKDGVFEDNGTAKKKFALLFQIIGNEKDQKFAFYECTADRPAMSANTVNDSIEPDTVTIPLTIAPHEMTVGTDTKKVIKYSMELTTKNAEEYGAWFTEVQTPAVAGA